MFLAKRRPTTCDITAVVNRRNFHVWNSHGHVTTLPVAILDAEISAVRFFAACCGWTIHMLQQNIWRSE